MHRRKTDYETRSKQRKIIMRLVIASIIFGVCMFITGTFLGKFVFGREEVQSNKEEKTDSVEATVAATENVVEPEDFSRKEPDWKLVLVNKNHSIEEGYEPELAEIENNYYFDVRAVEYLRAMLADGRREGLDFWICSAYRTIEKQTELFENQVSGHLNSGMSYSDALEKAATVVAYPGTSEHHLGLAVDIVARDYQLLDEYQAETDEAKWLKENCWKYGFILRYPLDKTEITGIVFEPWHYRYVGVEAAKEIMEQGLCLEEYLSVEDW